MAQLSQKIRFVVAILAAVSLLGTLTACSNDSKKGTPVEDRKVGGVPDTSADEDQRGTDGDADEKATRKDPTVLDERGTDSRASGTQIDGEGLPADVSQQRREERGSDTEIRVSSGDDIEVSGPTYDTGVNLGLGGELGFDNDDGSWLNLDYVGLTALAPDMEIDYISANQRDYRPIITLGTDPSARFDFTDFADDLLMNTILRLSMKSDDGNGYSDIRAGDNDFLPQEFFDDSREFAADIKDIRTKVGVTGADGRFSSVADVTVTYDYEGVNRTLNLKGAVDQNARRAVLRQTDANPQHDFQGYLTCLDTSNAPGGKCTNSILVIEQVLHGKICKRVFAVVRHMHVGVRIDRKDYRKYFDETNANKRAFLQYLSNTVVATRYANGYYIPADGDDLLLTLTGQVDAMNRPVVTLPTPFMEEITTRTFSVAHGFSESELEMVESGYERHQDSELSNPSLRDSYKDVFRLVSPLARAIPGNNVSAIAEVDGSRRGGLNMASTVESAEIVGNDGRGTMEIKYNFGGGDDLTVIYQADNVDMKDPRNIKLYPYQGSEAPGGITKAMMPVPFQ